MKLVFDDDERGAPRGVSRRGSTPTPPTRPRHRTPESSAHVPEWARPFQRRLFDAGWLVPGYPPEYGGRNASFFEQIVYLQEMGRRHITISFNPQGLSIITPSILAFGAEEQKRGGRCRSCGPR